MARFVRSGYMALTVVAAFALISSPAAAQSRETEDTSPKYTEFQKLGYLGRTSKSELARSVYERLKTRHGEFYAEDTLDRVRMWHEVMLDSVALDHTPDPDTGEVPFTQGGPTRTSRALAMVQIAVFDAVNAFDQDYEPYNDIRGARRYASRDTAIAWASYTVQRALYPEQRQRLTEILIRDLTHIKAGFFSRFRGRAVGRRAAFAILADRASDNSTNSEPSFGEGGRIADGTTTFRGGQVNDGDTSPFSWTPDPNTPEFDVLNFNVSLGAFWGGVTPFTLSTGNQFRIPPYPDAGTTDYIDAYNEVAAIGGSPDNTNTPSTSTAETRFVGNFWGYDAVPLLGTPPRAYNQIAVKVALDQGFPTQWSSRDCSRW